MTIVLYTDASHCHKKNVAACGFCAYQDGNLIKHDITFVAIKSSGLAERQSIIIALQWAFMIKDVSKIVLYTDHLSTVIIVDNKKERNKKRAQELFDTLEMITDYGVTVRIAHVVGHGNSKQNNKVDKSCLTALREYIKNNYASSKKRRHNPGNRR